MSQDDFSGKTVLVTGGSMGIGEAFARALDRRGARLVLVARSEDKLARLAAGLRDAVYVVADLSRPGAAQGVFDEVTRRGLEVDVLVNNAGFGAFGDFDTVPRSTQREMIDLNVGALVELTQLFMPTIARRRGGVVLVASTAAYFPVPRMATYGATKAFVLSFGEALWAEYRHRGVRVVTISPGATDTPFFARAGEAAAAGNAKASPDDVVALALRAWSRAARPSVIHGAGNAALAWLTRWLPRSFVARLAAWVTRPRPALPATASS